MHVMCAIQAFKHTVIAITSLAADVDGVLACNLVALRHTAHTALLKLSCLSSETALWHMTGATTRSVGDALPEHHYRLCLQCPWP